MNIVINREPTTPVGCTFGRLSVDGHYFCETLEDAIREVQFKPVAEWKVKNETAIPAGTYTVIVDFSTRFHRLMPHVIGVEGFEGVRIHPGNTTADTEGCVLVGFDRGDTEAGQLPLMNSRAAFEKLFDMMKASVAENDRVTVTLVNPPLKPAVAQGAV